MYTVYGTVHSRAFRVFWALEELGLPYERVDAAPRSDSVKALNPLGKIPVLVVDDTPIFDSTAIITYLADKHGGATYPAGSLERARQDARTNFALDSFDALLWVVSRHKSILPENLRVEGIRHSAEWEFERNAAQAAELLGDGTFLMGERFTIADIVLGHCLGWAQTARFALTEPALSDYLDRLRSRPAYQRARG